MPLCDRFDDLDLEECLSEEVGEGAKRRLSRARQSTPHLKIASTKKERSIIVVGDSFLRRMQGCMYQPEPTHREVWCLPGARIRSITGKLPGLVHSSDYYPSLVIQVGNKEATERSPESSVPNLLS